WNRGAERIYGYTTADMVNRNTREVLSPSDDVDTRALLDIVRSGQSVEHYETIRRTRSGEAIDVALTVSPIVDDRDRMVAASFISRDISAHRKEATRRNVEHAVTRALLQAESSTQALRDVIQALCLSLGWEHGARWYRDPESNMLRPAEMWTHPSLHASAFVANTAAWKGPPPGSEQSLVELVFDSGEALWSADICSDPRFIRANSARAAGLRTAFMFPVRSSNGTLGVLEFFSCERREPDPALFETAEAISGQIGQYIERHRAEEERIAADARLQRITANIPDVVFQLTLATDGSFRLPFISERIFDLYGMHATDLVKDPAHWLAAVVPEHRRMILKSLARSKRTWQPWSFEASIRCRNGAHKWVRGQASVRYASDGSVYWDGVLSDITLQKRAAIEILTMNEKLEKRVAERTRRLEAMNRELEAFSYSVSHDLRAPLRSVEGFCSLLLQKCGANLDATGVGYVDKVQGAGRRMSELVDDLLKLSRISRTELQFEEVDLSAMARQVVKALQEADTERAMQLDIEDGVSVQGDARLLHVVLENLLGNAWKFTQKTAHPAIAFGRVWHNGRRAIYVRDNGAGFDMKYAGKLFAPF
ncbi:MAG TPA: PAS domain-containing protein, partial [Burkholderiales bacterium]|nr:PAS domain-containing protein [Burkholderiales bacterium]